MSARWYKRVGADFIDGTMMLTLEEKGAYSVCIDLIYDRGGSIPDDSRWIAGVCGCSVRKWNAIRLRLIELKKLDVEEGRLSNSRARFELVSADLSSRERAESGARGGRKRAENAGERAKNNDLAEAKLKREEEIRGDKKEEGAAAQHQGAHARPQPVSEAVKIWNEAAEVVGWPLAQRASEARRRSIANRLRDETLEGWRGAVGKAQASPYLGHDPPAWFTIDWIAKPTNFLKLIEGNYDRKRTPDHERGSSAEAYLAGGDLVGVRR